ncbi:MAG: metalloregulator ArsR/SmtB family transcription factor [Armatimonadetes bacterium]|nr:metalloregulator ArsR/SmtB family transcription factor [Armatimonadota bacterium]
MDAAQVFKALSDKTRLRIVSLLARYDGLCVSHLVEALGMPQWRVSRHLQKLRQLGVVRSRTRGTWRHYSLTDGLRQAVRRVLAAVEERLDTQALRHDVARLRAALTRQREQLSSEG